VLNVKTDRSLKIKAKKVAKNLGLPLGTIVNHYLRQLVNEKRVVFSAHPTPNKKTWKLLRQASEDCKKGRNITGPFSSAKEIEAYLDS